MSNLQWCTYQQNSQHAVDTGLCPRPVGKAVVQLSKEGEFVAQYATMKEASEATGAPADTIKLVCVGKRKTSGGHKWRFRNEVTIRTVWELVFVE